MRHFARTPTPFELKSMFNRIKKKQETESWRTIKGQSTGRPFKGITLKDFV